MFCQPAPETHLPLESFASKIAGRVTLWRTAGGHAPFNRALTRDVHVSFRTVAFKGWIIFYTVWQYVLALDGWWVKDIVFSQPLPSRYPS